MSGFKTWVCFIIMAGWMGAMAAQAAEPVPVTGDSILAEDAMVEDELLESTPVDEDIQPAASTQAEIEMTPITPDSLPPGEPYPISQPASSAAPVAKPAGSDAARESVPASRKTRHVHQFMSYGFSAYVPEPDQTEVDLGLLLHEPPGIEAGLNWGALKELMVNAKLTVQGPSYTSGVRLRYALLDEKDADTHPAIAVNAGWLFMNHRKGDENDIDNDGDRDERLNIFRGNRFKAGVIFSKWLGSMARALDAKPEVEAFLDYFTLHVEALTEFQTGWKNTDEEAYSGIEFGARTSLEIEIDPETLYLSLVYDSLPDWLGIENYYIGVRYFAREDFAVDVVGGRISHDYGVNVGLAWMF